MSIRSWLRWPSVRAALAVLALALVGSAWMIASALRPEPIPEMAPARITDLSALGPPRAATPLDVSAAVENDVFSPDRSPPDHAYRMPGEALDTAAPADEARPVVLGTAIAADGSSFATCQLGTGVPRIVRIGDRVGDYTVKSIERGRVVFQRAGGARIDIAAQRPQA